MRAILTGLVLTCGVALGTVARAADDKPIDSLKLSVATEPEKPVGGAIATLSVTKAGAVAYTHTSAPHTGSGGKITKKEWAIPAQQAVAVLAGAVEDGLLELPAEGKARAHYHATIGRGRWYMSLSLDARPDKVLARVLPLLRHAHPEVWGAAAPTKETVFAVAKVDGKTKRIDGQVYHLVAIRLDPRFWFEATGYTDPLLAVGGALGKAAPDASDPEGAWDNGVSSGDTLLWLRLPEEGSIEVVWGALHYLWEREASGRDRLVKLGYTPFAVDVRKFPVVKASSAKELHAALDELVKGKVAAAPVPALQLRVTGPAKPVAAGDDITLDLILSTDGEGSHTFRLGAFPQAFGIYVLGPWGAVSPDPTKLRPENWMQQQHSAAATITVSKGKPHRIAVKLSDYFNVTDQAQFKAGGYQVNVKFYETGLKMPVPIDSGATRFDIAPKK